LTRIVVNDIIYLTTKVVIMKAKVVINCAALFRKDWYVRKRRYNLPLYNHLKEYRAKLGVNQQEMGALVDVSRQTISQIERGDYSPSVTLALKIAKVCGCSVEDIFNYEEETK